MFACNRMMERNGGRETSFSLKALEGILLMLMLVFC
jgi:hypothetical protein